MRLKRTNLIMEFGPYGPSLRSTTGFSAPVGARRFNTWPFIPDMRILKQKEEEAERRRNRLRELSLGWYIFGPTQSTANTVSPSASSGSAPGSIF